MFIFGQFCDRDESQKIDLVATEQQLNNIFDDEDDVLGTDIGAFAVEAALRDEFDTLANLVKRAKARKPFVIDKEEVMFACAATRNEAIDAFMKAFLKN